MSVLLVLPLVIVSYWKLPAVNKFRAEVAQREDVVGDAGTSIHKDIVRSIETAEVKAHRHGRVVNEL